MSERLTVHVPGSHHRVRGHRLWMEQEGVTGEILLLSGLGPAGLHLVLGPQFSQLAADHRVIYVDLFGRRRSDVSVERAEITFGGDGVGTAALIDTLGVGPVHVYGFSYGGLLGQALALAHLALVRTLTVANIRRAAGEARW